MSDTTFIALVVSLIIAFIISVYVAYRLFLQPALVKDRPLRFSIPLGVALILALVSGLTYNIDSATPRSDFSCRTDGYPVPATLTCEAHSKVGQIDWSLLKGSRIRKSSEDLIEFISDLRRVREQLEQREARSDTSRFFHKIVKSGHYDLLLGIDTSFLGFSLSSTTIQGFDFGTAADMSGREARTVNLRYENTSITGRHCETHTIRLDEESGAKIGYYYISQIQALDGRLEIVRSGERELALTACFHPNVILPLWKKAFVQVQLVYGIERGK